MRTKLVPEPPATVQTVVDARHAIPLVPASAADCRVRLVGRVGDPLEVTTSDEAGEWLEFLAALGVIVETESGYRRPRDDLTRADLATALCERVFGAQELLSALDSADPIDADTAFERIREIVPTWERHHHADWEREWRGRVERLLDWLLLANLAERVEKGYRAA